MPRWTTRYQRGRGLTSTRASISWMMLTSRFRAATRSRSPPPRPLLRKGIAGM